MSVGMSARTLLVAAAVLLATVHLTHAFCPPLLFPARAPPPRGSPHFLRRPTVALRAADSPQPSDEQKDFADMPPPSGIPLPPGMPPPPGMPMPPGFPGFPGMPGGLGMAPPPGFEASAFLELHKQILGETGVSGGELGSLDSVLHPSSP